MRQYKQHWATRWDGHTIVVEKWFALLIRNGENVFVDGDLVCERRRSWSTVTPNFEAEIHDAMGVHQLRIQFGTSNTLDEICHIFVNDELVGGDTVKKMLPLETPIPKTPPLSISEQRKKLKRELFTRLIGMALAIVVYFVLGTYSKPLSDQTVIIIFSLWWLCEVLSNVYKIRKLPPENPTDNLKNSTPV